MRDLTPWLSPLPVTENPGLDSVDPRLTGIMGLVARRMFQDAADRAEDVLAEGIYDIRPLSCQLLAAFLDGGFQALPEVLRVVSQSIGENFLSIGPVKKREDHFDRRLAWLFETMLETSEYHQKKASAEWARWNDGLEASKVYEAVEAGDELMKAWGTSTYPTAGRMLGRLLSHLRGHGTALRAPTEPPEPVAKAFDVDVDAESLHTLRRKVELVVSQHFVELSNKLRAFEMLIEKGEQQKAALVADDVLATLDAFDPRLYFPELFSRFSGLVSSNIGVLSAHWEQKDSIPWKALTQYYRVDLKSFVEG